MHALTEMEREVGQYPGFLKDTQSELRLRYAHPTRQRFLHPRRPRYTKFI
jgi:hypothetical protein